MAKVFLSYNSEDAQFVQNIAAKLQKEEDLFVWMDRGNLLGGDSITPKLEEAFQESNCCVVFIGPSGTGPWQHEEMEAAIRRDIDNRKNDCFRVFMVLLPGAEKMKKSSLPTFLQNRRWIEFRDGINDEVVWSDFLASVRGKWELDSETVKFLSGKNPYKSLNPFGYNKRDVKLFSGRQSQVDWLLEDFKECTGPGHRNRFLIVSGASGTGKSSMVMAGFLGNLASHQDSHPIDETKAVMRPGVEPLYNFCLALGKAGKWDDARIENVYKKLQSTPRSVRSVVQSYFESDSDRRLLLVVDQLEELTTQSNSERDKFLDVVHTLTRSPDGRTIIVGTLRSDYFAAVAELDGMKEVLGDNQRVISPMSEFDLRECIERPALLCGGGFQDGLVNILVEEFKKNPSSLPLLQHYLFLLWEKSPNGIMDTSHHAELRGIEGAINRHATIIFDSLSSEEREICKDVFLRLVNPAKDGNHTKRQEHLVNLGTDAESAEIANKIVLRFADPDVRLLTIDESMVEVSHEALIRGWETLRDWIEEDRESFEIRYELARASQQWNKNNRKVENLMRGRQLIQFAGWVNKNIRRLNPLEREYIIRSWARSDYDLVPWLRPFDQEKDLLPLARSYLENSSEPSNVRAAIRLLRSVEAPHVSEEARSLLGDIAVGEHDQNVRQLAVKAIALREDGEWFVQRYAETDLEERPKLERRRFIQSIGFLRNLSQETFKLLDKVPRELRKRSWWETILQLISIHRNLFGLVLAFSFGLSILGWLVTQLISFTVDSVRGESLEFFYVWTELTWEYVALAPLSVVLSYLIRLRSGLKFSAFAALRAGFLGGVLICSISYLIPFVLDFSASFSEWNEDHRGGLIAPMAPAPVPMVTLKDSQSFEEPTHPEEVITPSETSSGDSFYALTPPNLKWSTNVEETRSERTGNLIQNNIQEIWFKYRELVEQQGAIFRASTLMSLCIGVLLCSTLIGFRVRTYISGTASTTGDLGWGIAIATLASTVMSTVRGDYVNFEATFQFIANIAACSASTSIFLVLFLIGVRLGINAGRKDLDWKPLRSLRETEGRTGSAYRGLTLADTAATPVDTTIEEAKGCWWAMLRLFFWFFTGVLALILTAVGITIANDDFFSSWDWPTQTLDLGVLSTTLLMGALLGCLNFLIPWFEGGKPTRLHLLLSAAWIPITALGVSIVPLLIMFGNIEDWEEEGIVSLACALAGLWVLFSMVWNFWWIALARKKANRTH